MYTASELERASMALDEPMKTLENSIMSDIVRRIRDNGEITSAADWQITRLVQLGMGMAEITAAIDQALGVAEDITETLFTDVISAGYARDKSLYEAIGKVQIPFEENEPLQQLISSITAQTNETMHNITQSLGFAQRGSDGHLSFTPIADYYQRTLDKAMLDISSGAFDYNTVLKRTVKEMTDSGLRTVDYATGWSNRVNVAARRAVMTGMTQLTAQVNEQNAEALETEWFEISWHSGARSSHWWGGKWYTKEQLTTICKLGDVQGLCGANCYHDYSPVIPGISEPTYTEEELAELNRQEKEPIEYNGKQYTKYEALQRQRRLETTMRAQRQEMALLKEGGADEDDLINCRARYRGTSQEYTAFSKAMGLPQQRERVFADGLGNIMQGKTEGGSGKESPVSVPPVGAHVTGKVTAEERKDLLSQNKVDIHKIPLENDNINVKIEKRGRKLSLNDLEDFENWQNDYYTANSGASFTRQDNPNIFEYTGGSYEAVNGFLRGGESLEKVKRRYGTAFDKEKYERISEGISSELSKFKLNEPLELRRSVSNVDFITGSTSSVEDMKKAIGKTFVEKGFTSTTVCSDTMLPFGYGSTNRTTLEIFSEPLYTKGAYIYKISEHPAEFEFLIDKNTAFKVVDAGEREIEVKDFRGNIRKEKERYMRLQVIKNG